MTFFSEESAIERGKYLVRPDFDKLPKMYTSGSYAVLGARLLGLSYPDYLRYCRDAHNATLFGKNDKYITVYFNSKSDADGLAKILDAAAVKVMRELEI